MAEARRSVRMTDDEAWQMLEQSVNGILTTLRRDGRPVTLPIWYVVLDRRIYIGTRGKKVLRARNDPRCSFLVEAGERWADLRAVHLDGLVTVIDPHPGLAGRTEAARDPRGLRAGGACGARAPPPGKDPDLGQPPPRPGLSPGRPGRRSA